MFTRTTGLIIVPLWLAAMGWLVAHDVWPALTAQELPRVQPSDWLREEGNQAQFSIRSGDEPVGTIWTEYLVGDEAVERTDLIWLENLPIAVEALRITVNSSFSPSGLLDEFTLVLRTGTELGFKLHGERFPSDFSFEFESGPIEKAFKVPLIDGGMIAGAFNPFVQLEDLHVGQTWRIQVFNPLSALTGMGSKLTSMVVEVTGEETISTPRGHETCFVVEAPNAKAWVDKQGAVLVQKVFLPMVGWLSIIREPGFDEDDRRAKRDINLRSLNLRRREDTQP